MANVSILIAINGTHDNKFLTMADDEYDRNFKSSHVRRIYENSTCKYSIYLRGPNGVGSEVAKRISQALTYIWQIQKINPGASLAIHLVGFSRGAAMCLELANWLTMRETIQGGGLFPSPQELHAGNINALDRALISVSTLGMFDAVDMSVDMDCNPVHPGVGNSVLIRRGIWNSREGWTNVGDINPPAAASNGVRKRWLVMGTHGALGGQPVNGDIPIPLARELVGALGLRISEKNLYQWVFAAERWKRLTRAGSIANVKLKFNSPLMTFNGPPLANPNEFYDLFSSYASGSYMMDIYGLRAGSENENLFGFPGLFWIFQDYPICMGIIERYAALDRKASRDALLLMKKSLGPAFPASL